MMERYGPKLRFPGFEGEWEEKKLSAVTSRIGDGIHGTPTYDDFGDYYFINGNNLVDGQVVYTASTKKVNSKEFEKQKLILDSTTVLMSINGTVGSLALFDNEKVLLGKSACYINVAENHSKYFFYFILQSKRLQEYFASNVSGSTIKNLSLGTIRNTLISFPDFDEQNKISAFLEAVDRKLAQIKKKKSFLEQYKKGMMQKIFNQEIRFKDDDGKEFGEWEDKTIADILTMKYGKDQKQVESSEGAYPILGTGGEMGRTDQFLFDKPSVLIGRKGTIDRPMYLDTPFWTVDTLFYTDIKERNLPKWVFYLFQTINWYLYNEASGVPSLSTSTINKIIIAVPEYKEQVRIADFFSVIDDKISLMSRQIEKVEVWKKGLLAQMFV